MGFALCWGFGGLVLLVCRVCFLLGCSVLLWVGLFVGFTVCWYVLFCPGFVCSSCLWDLLFGGFFCFVVNLFACFKEIGFQRAARVLPI